MKRIALVLVGLAALGLGGLAQALGTPERPIIMLFVPSVKVDVIMEVGPKIAEALSQMTGLVIKPVVAADYAAFIEAFIAARGDTFGVPTTDQYVRIVEANPGVHARLAAVRAGYPYYFATIYALREKGYKSVYDLQGKVWGFAHTRSTSGYVIPKMYFDRLGLTFAEEKALGSHVKAMIALLEGDVDFCTGYGSPPLPPDTIAEALKAAGWRWEFGMDPELWLWDRWNNDLYPEGIRGHCRDLRWAIATEVKVYGDIWTLVRKVGIVDVVGPMPNDCIAFSAGFPKDLEDRIVEAIKAHIRSPEGNKLWSRPGFYEWYDVAEIDDSFYDPYRKLVGLPIPKR
ncbi:MAG: PhnD/SsuA/transferrin family substrate-binding protein [Candidatus Bipolaricaulaceae bacterium]